MSRRRGVVEESGACRRRRRVKEGERCVQCAKQPAYLGLTTEGPVHRTGPALFMPWSDAPGLSAHTLAVRSVGQKNGSPQWGVVHEHTRRPTPVFMNTKMCNSNFHRHAWACGGRPPASKQHTPTPVDGALTGRSMVGRCSTAKVDFGLLTPNFPLFVNKQRRLLCALPNTFLNPQIQTSQEHLWSRCGKARFVFDWSQHFG